MIREGFFFYNQQTSPNVFLQGQARKAAAENVEPLKSRRKLVTTAF